MIDRDLLRDLLRLYPAQPASAIWRAVEIGALLRLGIPAGRGLDLGCGDGKLTGLILERVGDRQLVGIDIDPFETSTAVQSGLFETVHNCSGENIPEENGSFDFVISNSVLEHIPKLEPVLNEVGRLLRPGGRFLFTVPGPGFHGNLRGSLLPWVSRRRYLDELDRRVAHLRYTSSADWVTLCRGAGLRMEACLGYLDRNETHAWETLARFTSGLLYTLFGKRQSPIIIQRKLGLRQLQNKIRLPSTLASSVAVAITTWVGPGHCKWLSEESASCLLVVGSRA